MNEACTPVLVPNNGSSTKASEPRPDALLLDLRLTELETHEAVRDQLTLIYKSGYWRKLGHKSLAVYCRKELMYKAPEARFICIEIGAILTSQELVSSDPLVQMRIEKLRNWRKQRATFARVPAYRFLSNRTLLAVATENPLTAQALLRIKGVGQNKMNQFGNEILELLKTH